MVQSPEAQSRARLIREMSRDLSRKRPLENGSRESTTSDFDPENEALLSTRQLDNTTQRLPALRASAQKYKSYSKPEPEYAINTSAIGRAFPDFSREPSSDEDSMSIELGRGHRKGSNGAINKLERPGRYPSKGKGDYHDDSLDLSDPMIRDYQVMGTPPMRSRVSSGKGNTNLFGKQGTQRSAHLPKTTEYGSGDSRQSSKDYRGPLASLHAQVADKEEGSRLGHDRPPTVNLTSRNTRFRGSKSGNHESVALPSKYSSKTPFAPTRPQASSSQRRDHNGETASQDYLAAQQSFLIPDMPNLSELVSGVFQDGTPVFTRQTRSRPSRFVSSSHRLQGIKGVDQYAEVAEIPVPDEEQAIFMSLKLLQDKVSDLESGRAEAEATIEELQAKLRFAEQGVIENQRRRRSDSALGTTDGSDAGAIADRGPRKWAVEKSRLEGSVRVLGEQLHAAKHQVSVSNITIKNLSQERDAAISQLGVAYITTEQLKSEIDLLKDENRQLKNRLHQESIDQHYQDHVETQELGKAMANRGEIEPASGDPLEEHDQQRRHIVDTARQSRQSEIPAAKSSTTSRKPPQEPADLVRDDTQNLNGKVSRQVAQSRRQGKSYGSSRQIVDERNDSQASSDESIDGQDVKHPAVTREKSKDLTFLSIVNSGKIAKLRKTLEYERRARQQQHDLKPATVEGRDNTLRSGISLPSHAPRKSAAKETTTGLNQSREVRDNDKRSVAAEDHTTHSRASKVHHRRHSEDSLLQARGKLQGKTTEDLTSAFILPDITMKIPKVGVEPVAGLSKAAQEVVNELAQHDGQNCIICKGVLEHGTPHQHDVQKIVIPKPVPVSERALDPRPYEEEPTIRPSQPPALALAIVLKGLQDELSHLKLQISHYQSIYNQHDPALSKRKRKAVHEKIAKLLKTIDAKSDQIYALYDVLEGQKADGHEITEEEVEVTLQSLGVNVNELGLRGGDLKGGENEQAEGRHSWEIESSNGSEDGLPWEGIENTKGSGIDENRSERLSS